MSNDQITFSCSSCGVELKVPLSFAGVTGPCPGCQASITAPQPERPAASPPPPASLQAPPQQNTPAAPANKATPSTPEPESGCVPEHPLSAPAAAILTAAPAPTKTSSAPAAVPEPLVSAPAPSATLIPEQSSPIPSSPPTGESPVIPDFSIPSVPDISTQRQEKPATKEKFPSVPSTPENFSSEKTILPPRRAEVDLPAPLAPPTAAPFPSSLISPSGTPEDQAPTVIAPEPTITEVPEDEDIPVLGPRPTTTPNITPPPEPVAPLKTSVPAPAFVVDPPSPSVPKANPVPEKEPQSGTTAYPVTQAPTTVTAKPAAYPTAPPSQEAPAPPPQTPVAPAAPVAGSPAAPAAGTSIPASHGLSTFSPPPKETPKEEKDQKPKKPKGKLWWLRIVIPILFLALCGLVVYLVTDLLQKVADHDSGKGQLNVPSAPNATAREEAKKRIAMDNSTSETKFSVPPKRLDPVSADVAVDSSKLYIEGEPPPLATTRAAKRETPSSVDIAPSDASSVLDRFLNASTLDERMPYLARSNRSAKELAASSLASPLPEVLHSRLLHYMVNNAERHTEHFFEVSFQKKLGERPYSILIQINDWGEGQYKVHTDAFLDLFEDKLSQFANKPLEGTRTFHVVADAYKHCFDEIIPDWEQKSFLKLRNHPRMSPRMIAYFNRNSHMAEDISRPDALPWGESGICTVTVAWNTKNPDNPFVELVDVVAFTWEP